MTLLEKVEVRVTRDLKRRFAGRCARMKTTPSDLLRHVMHLAVKKPKGFETFMLDLEFVKW